MKEAEVSHVVAEKGHEPSDTGSFSKLEKTRSQLLLWNLRKEKKTFPGSYN